MQLHWDLYWVVLSCILVNLDMVELMHWDLHWVVFSWVFTCICVSSVELSFYWSLTVISSLLWLFWHRCSIGRKSEKKKLGCMDPIFVVGKEWALCDNLNILFQGFPKNGAIEALASLSILWLSPVSVWVTLMEFRWNLVPDRLIYIPSQFNMESDQGADYLSWPGINGQDTNGFRNILRFWIVNKLLMKLFVAIFKWSSFETNEIFD